ncbi:MAG: SMC family ATPase [Planctomycetes bacterium]|nr:SMC family ATPase [Planctomycetota bacterium]
MRPLRLQLSAFGPYAGEQVVDFSQLNGRSFFLIHGATGAGKTTLLDALCFALYGVSSGLERQAKALRSDLADPNLPTAVTFDFALGNEVYRVHRAPEQERPKKRGPGMTALPAQATLWRRTGAAEGQADGTVVASRWDKVTEAVERLIGLHSDQFRQVILIPQGEFRQLLTASSKERQEILEVLFQAAAYRRIEEALKESAREVSDQLKDAERRRQILLEQAAAKAVEEIEARKLEKSGLLDSSRGQRQALEARELEVHHRVLQARQVLEKIRERDEALLALQALEKHRGEFEAARKELERARQASLLLEAEANLKYRAEEARDAAGRLEKLEGGREELRQEKRKAGERLAGEEIRTKEREEARREIHRLEELAAKAGDLERLRASCRELEASVRQLAEDRDRAQKALLDGEVGLEKKKAELVQAEKTALGLESHKAALEEARRRLGLRRRLEEARGELKPAQEKLAAARSREEAAERAFREARGRLELLKRAWEEGQAAILARQLEAGKPCPVCGSPHHPAPAAGGQDLPSEAALKKGEEELAALESDREARRRAPQELQTRLDRLLAEAAALEQSLGAAAAADLAALERQVRELEGAVKAAEEALVSAASSKIEIERLKREQIQQKSSLEESGGRLQAKEAETLRAQAVLEEREGELPEGLRSLETLSQAKSQAEQRSEGLEKALQAAQREAKKAGEDLAASEATCREAKGRAEEAERRLAQTRADFDARREQAGFADFSSYEAARRSPPEIARLEESIQRYFQNLHAAGERAQRAREAAGGLAAPDLEGLEREEKKLKEETAGLHQREAALLEQLKQIDQWLNELKKNQGQLEALERRYQAVGGLAEVANGKNPQGITFQRFVLAAMLDDVLIAASERLRLMSRGRFTLQRALERADQRAAFGLDLEVFDAYTGTARGVATLSGGESFLASLSLALGLADAVQSYSGGTYLETLFIDEGFGTLDPESLELALRALIDLQKGGRLVGIISHVPELKERIDARLEVMPGKKGSTARFVVG